MSAITEKDWECPICLSVMDGVNQGQVALSKRCYHVFHKVCIEQSLNEANRKCPKCNLENFSICEVLPNPEFETQYQKWDLDRIGYTYERAVREEYGRSSQQVGFDPSHILRPVAFRGLDQRRSLTSEEVHQFYLEINLSIQNLDINSTPAQIEKARREIEAAEDLIINNHQEQLNDIGRDFSEMRAGNAHLWLVDRYRDRVALLQEKINYKEKSIEEEISQLRKLRPRSDSISEKLSCLNTFSLALTNLSLSIEDYKSEFLESGKLDERTIEESQELLKEVDARLDAFIEEQPAHIKEILNAPLPVEPNVPVQPNEDPIQPEPPIPEPQKREGYIQNDAAKCRNFLRISLFAGCVWGLFKLKDYIYKTFWEKRSKTS